MNERIIGIDYGSKRIGIAMTDPLGITVQPYMVCDKNNIMPVLEDIFKKEQVGKLVLGLPLSLDGTEGHKVIEVRKFAEKLKQHFNINIEFYDERFTTRDVETMLIDEADMPRKKRKKIIDKLAACYILKRYLDSKK